MMIPCPYELHCDRLFEDLVDDLCNRPGKYGVFPVSYGSVCAYLSGFDAARGGGAMLGFPQWLIVRLNDGNNLHWAGLARRLFPENPREINEVKLSDEMHEIQSLRALL